MTVAWPYIITIISVLPLILTGVLKLWWGWAVGLLAQVVWILYTIDTAQWGFILNVIIYTVVYVVSLIKAIPKEDQSG